MGNGLDVDEAPQAAERTSARGGEGAVTSSSAGAGAAASQPPLPTPPLSGLAVASGDRSGRPERQAWSIRRSRPDDDSPRFFGTERDSFTGDLWADVKSGAVADRIYAFLGGAADAVGDTITGVVDLLKPGGIEKALSSLGKLPANLKLVFEHRDEFIASFEALPPKEQARVIGRLTAQIETVLAGGLGGGTTAVGGTAPRLAEAAVAAGRGVAAMQRGEALTIDLARLGEAGTEMARAGYLTAKAGEGGGAADDAAQEIKQRPSKPEASDAATTDAGGSRAPKASGEDPNWVARRHGMDAPAVQAGHRISRWFTRKTGGVEEFAVEDADLNQLSNWTLETAKKGGVSQKSTILVRGLYVDRDSALLWAGNETGELTGLTKQFVQSFKEVPGWKPPAGCKNPNATFMREMLEVLDKDKSHPFRFLIDGVRPAKGAAGAPAPR